MCNIQLNMFYQHKDKHKAMNNTKSKRMNEYVPTNSRLLHMVCAMKICRRKYTRSDNMLVIS